MESLELDSLYLSKRILVDSDECNDFVSGGVLVSNVDGTIKRIMTSQEEINSWMFRSTGSEVIFFSFRFLVYFCNLYFNNTLCSAALLPPKLWTSYLNDLLINYNLCFKVHQIIIASTKMRLGHSNIHKDFRNFLFFSFF
jgi:hypothetical protein